MKVKIEYTLEVDVEEWANRYGFPEPKGVDAWRELREDVKNYFGFIPDHLEDIVKMK